MSHALKVACYNDRHDVVKWLASHPTANASSTGVVHPADGEVTSLMTACTRGHKRIAIQLLQCVTPHTVNMMSGKLRDTALHLTCSSETNKRLYTACDNGDVDAMSELLSTCDVDLQTSHGSTLLHLACENGHVEVVRLLLSTFA
jgi:ankyrin repeat protein